MTQPIHILDRPDQIMRTDIDDTLMTKAMSASGLDTKKATVEEALRRMVRRREGLDALAELSGVGWDGDLHALLEGRTFPDKP